MQFTTSMFSALALASAALALPSPPTAYIQISATPSTNATYLSYRPNFFGDLALLPDADKANAIPFYTLLNDTIVSSTGEGLGIGALAANGQPLGALTYSTYTGLEGTSFSSPSLEVVNTDASFKSWVLCESQYGANLQFASPEYNQTELDAGMPFPCYEVEFYLTY